VLPVILLLGKGTEVHVYVVLGKLDNPEKVMSWLLQGVVSETETETTGIGRTMTE
jgi:hypothetical protein